MMSAVSYKKQYTDEQIVQKAKELGMEYPEEFKVISKDVE